MKLYEKLDDIKYQISQLFTNELAEDCINYLVGKLIIKIGNNEVMDEEELSLLFQAGLDQQYIYESNDLVDLILEMKAMARERSHGAAPLSRVYISSKHYADITESLDIDKSSVLTIGKVIVYKSDELTKFANVFGVCKPKFDCVSPELIVILGNIKE